MVGEILKNIRKINKLEQKQVADYLSVDENTISNYEKENSNITFEMAIKFIHSCNFDMQIIDKENDKVYKIDKYCLHRRNESESICKLPRRYWRI